MKARTRNQASLAPLRKEATIKVIHRANQEATAGCSLSQKKHIFNQETKGQQEEEAKLMVGNNNQPPEDGEWTTVKKKHYVRKTQSSKFTNPYLERKLQILRGQGKCYRCLERGRTQVNCRNSLKCYTCHKLGHTSGRCKKKDKLFERTTNRPQGKASEPTAQNRGDKHNQNKEQEKTENKEEAMDNWQTMPMLPLGRLPGSRPEQQTVYVANREGFHPANEALERAASVHVSPNVNKQTLPQRLATTLAAQFGHHPRDFEVGKIDHCYG